MPTSAKQTGSLVQLLLLLGEEYEVVRLDGRQSLASQIMEDNNHKSTFVG